MQTLTETRRRANAASSFSRALVGALMAFAALAPPGLVAQAAPPSSSPPPAVSRLFDVVRPAYSGDRALSTVAFVEQRWRWPGNRGFEESIDHIAEQLRAAGYVEEKAAKPADRLTFRIEQRPMNSSSPVRGSSKFPSTPLTSATGVPRVKYRSPMSASTSKRSSTAAPSVHKTICTSDGIQERERVVRGPDAAVVRRSPGAVARSWYLQM